MAMTLREAQDKVGKFATERAWDINMPTQRIAHLQREVSRLSEHTMFEEGMTIKKPESDKAKLIGDCMFSLLSLANRLSVDVEEQLTRAMAADAVKYPAEKTKEAQLKAVQAAKYLYTIR